MQQDQGAVETVKRSESGIPRPSLQDLSDGSGYEYLLEGESGVGKFGTAAERFLVLATSNSLQPGASFRSWSEGCLGFCSETSLEPRRLTLGPIARLPSSTSSSPGPHSF